MDGGWAWTVKDPGLGYKDYYSKYCDMDISDFYPKFEGIWKGEQKRDSLWLYAKRYLVMREIITMSLSVGLERAKIEVKIRGNNMTIYVVTSGSYSDYCINQVFLTREKALAFIKAREAKYKYDGYGIEVYETHDECIETADGYLDNVYMACAVYCDLENEGRWYVDSWQTVSYEYEQPEIQELYDWRIKELLKIKVKLTVNPQLTNDQIIKIAQDVYAKWKAEREES